jgi:hypothetical protein
MGRDSSVGVGTRYAMDGPLGERISAPFQTGPMAHPASYTMGTASFPEVNRPGCVVDHSPLLTLRL